MKKVILQMKEMKLVIHMERTMDEKMTILLQAKNLRLYLLLIKKLNKYAQTNMDC